MEPLLAFAFCGLALSLRYRASQRSLEEGAGLCVSSLHIYPVKGLRGHSVARAPLDARGLRWDRRWMLLRGGAAALFTTQRQVPSMATLEATVLLPPSHAALAVPPAAVVDAGVPVPSLQLVATAGPCSGRRFVAPIVTLSGAGAYAAAPCVLVWGNPVSGAVDQGDAVGAWLSEVLAGGVGGLAGGEEGREPPEAEALELRLIYFDPAATDRLMSESFIPPHAPPLVKGVAFPDGYPMLLASTQSLKGEGVRYAWTRLARALGCHVLHAPCDCSPRRGTHSRIPTRAQHTLARFEQPSASRRGPSAHGSLSPQHRRHGGPRVGGR